MWCETRTKFNLLSKKKKEMGSLNKAWIEKQKLDAQVELNRVRLYGVSLDIIPEKQGIIEGLTDGDPWDGDRQRPLILRAEGMGLLEIRQVWMGVSISNFVSHHHIFLLAALSFRISIFPCCLKVVRTDSNNHIHHWVPPKGLGQFLELGERNPLMFDCFLFTLLDFILTQAHVLTVWPTVLDSWGLIPPDKGVPHSGS